MSPQPIWSRRIADELWSGVVTPLTYTMLADLMAEHMVRRRLDRAGLAALGAQQVFRLERGHVYVNASLVADVMREVPSLFLSDGLLALLPAELRDSVRREDRSLLAPSLASILLNLGWNERGWMPWSRGEVFREAAERAARELAVLSPPSDAECIVAAIDDVRAKLASYLEAVSWGMIYAYVFFNLTAQLLERWAPETSSIAALTMGIDGIWTFAIHEDLLACAALARSDPRLRSALDGDAERIAERWMRGELGELGVRLLGLLARHGHRLVGRDLSYPTWRERPAVVVEMLRKLLDADTPLTSEERRARRGQEMRRAIARIGGGPTGMVRRLVFERSFAWCQEYYVLRENMRYHADLFLSALRMLSTSAAPLLVARGALRDSSDVFYLEAGELRTALSPGAVDVTMLATRAVQRREAYDAYRRDPPPELLSDADPQRVAVVAPLVEMSGDGGLCGVGVSPGRAVGAARVVHSVDDLKAVRVGEVIVAASTDPSWTSLLALGGALVLEMGGLLSHGAIVARELGIPAVVDVPHATRLLATGDRIVVDGRAGTVARA